MSSPGALMVAVLVVGWVSVALGTGYVERLVANAVMSRRCPSKPLTRVVVAFVVGAVACPVLTALCHLLGMGTGRAERGYPYTGLITACYVPVFVIGGPATSFFAARLTGVSWPFALGVIVPGGVALAVEVTIDPTSHNLFPFEVVLVWGPAFLISWGAGVAALVLRRRAR